MLSPLFLSGFGFWFLFLNVKVWDGGERSVMHFDSFVFKEKYFIMPK